MRSAIAALMIVGTAVASGDQEKETPIRPGQMTKANVFIEKRGVDDAIPVVVERLPAAPFRARLSRQIWEYRTVTITPGDDAARVLSTYGLDGWETTGIQVTDGTRVLVLLKRPAENAP
jgi:hypothetical protein